MVNNSNAMPAVPPNTAVASGHWFTGILEILKTCIANCTVKQTQQNFHDQSLAMQRAKLPRGSMSRVDRIVKINAGENCENVRLEEGDQQFESHQRHRHSERDDPAEPSKNTHCAQHGGEGTKHIERDMTGKDIG